MSLAQRIYYVNTLNKTSGTNHSFSYEFQIPDNEKYDRVVLLQASIPVSFYLVQDGFNTFILREDGVDTTITIPPGNYSAKVFALVLAPLINAASPNGWVYTMTLPNQNLVAGTGKFTYTVTGNSSQPSIICTENVNEQLGFIENTTNDFVANTLTSTTCINFAAESQFFIHSDIADNGDSNVLQEIYGGNTPFMSYITYQCTAPDMYSKAIHYKQSSIFNFSLQNEKRQPLNLNGVNMQLTLCLYRKDETSELIRNYIQYRVHTDPQAQQ